MGSPFFSSQTYSNYHQQTLNRTHSFNTQASHHCPLDLATCYTSVTVKIKHILTECYKSQETNILYSLSKLLVPNPEITTLLIIFLQ